MDAFFMNLAETHSWVYYYFTSLTCSKVDLHDGLLDRSYTLE